MSRSLIHIHVATLADVIEAVTGEMDMSDLGSTGHPTMPFSHETEIIMSIVGNGKGSRVEMEPQVKPRSRLRTNRIEFLPRSGKSGYARRR